MIKCPYCKESFEEKEIVEMEITKEKVPAKKIGFGDPNWQDDHESIFYFVLSCPKCKTILGFVNNSYP